MATSIATQAPTFHAITGTQPIGHTQISVRGDYANTVTTVRRQNTDYYLVTVRQAKNAFAGAGARVQRTTLVWKDGDGSYVADYWDTARCDQPIEAARSWDLRAALAVAIGMAAERGHQDGLW